MDHVLKPFSYKFIVMHFDDILVYYVDVVTHLEHLRIGIEMLQRNKLYNNLKKWSFLQSNMDFLGFIINVNGIRSIKLKIQDIR